MARQATIKLAPIAMMYIVPDRWDIRCAPAESTHRKDFTDELRFCIAEGVGLDGMVERFVREIDSQIAVGADD